MHMYPKYEVAIFNIAKVIANVKFDANKPRNQQTNMAKITFPQYRPGDLRSIALYLLSI